MFTPNIVKKLSGAIDKISEMADEKVEQVKTTSSRITRDTRQYAAHGKECLTKNARRITGKTLKNASDGMDCIVKLTKDGVEKGKHVIDAVINYLTLNIINRLVSLTCQKAFKYQIQRAKKHNSVHVGIYDNQDQPIKTLIIEAETIAPEVRYNQWYYTD